MEKSLPLPWYNYMVKQPPAGEREHVCIMGLENKRFHSIEVIFRDPVTSIEVSAYGIHMYAYAGPPRSEHIIRFSDFDLGWYQYQAETLIFRELYVALNDANRISYRVSFAP
jgi:hypothetical protein